MANEQRLIDANELVSILEEYATGICYEDIFSLSVLKRIIGERKTVDAVEVPDKELLRAIKQYEHSKNSEYVHSPVAHALYHTWKQVEEMRTAP